MPPFNKSHVFTLLLISCVLGTTCFWGGILYFHKTKGRETLSRSYNDLNTTYENVEATDSFSESTKLPDTCSGIFNYLVFELSFEFFLFTYFFNHTWSKMCVINSQIRQNYYTR
jgi:peptide methionine sulfoxide reductase MsrA